MTMTNDQTWMEQAMQQAAQCWCHDETKGIVMDTVLAKAVARQIAAWMDTAARAQRDTDYYRGLVVRCGKAIGEAAYIADDGGRHNAVLCAKVPELVEALYSKFPDIGKDPLKTDGKERLQYFGHASVLARLQKACAIQQKDVPDQTALVWRADLSHLLAEFAWREAGHKAAIENEERERFLKKPIDTPP